VGGVYWVVAVTGRVAATFDCGRRAVFGCVCLVTRVIVARYGVLPVSAAVFTAVYVQPELIDVVV